MNYDFRKHCRRFFAEGSINAEAFSARVTDMLMRYRRQITAAQLNLLDSHDVSRFLSLCGGDWRRYKLAVLFMLCFVGMPTVFYGDELGVQGVLEKDYRAPMPWEGGDGELWEFFRKAICLRKENIALRRGSYRLLEAREQFLVFERSLGEEKITVALNAGEKEQRLPAAGRVLLEEGWENGRLSGFGFVVFR